MCRHRVSDEFRRFAGLNPDDAYTKWHESLIKAVGNGRDEAGLARSHTSDDGDDALRAFDALVQREIDIRRPKRRVGDVFLRKQIKPPRRLKSELPVQPFKQIAHQCTGSRNVQPGVRERRLVGSLTGEGPADQQGRRMVCQCCQRGDRRPKAPMHATCATWRSSPFITTRSKNEVLACRYRAIGSFRMNCKESATSRAKRLSADASPSDAGRRSNRNRYAATR
jgi:hypothetical protein